MRDELLLKGYEFQYELKNEKIHGCYIKRKNELSIENIYEEKPENLVYLKVFENILEAVDPYVTNIVVFYDDEGQIYVSEIREKQYEGPYCEEYSYKVLFREFGPSSLSSLFTLNEEIGKFYHKHRKEAIIGEINSIMNQLSIEELQCLLNALKNQSTLKLNQSNNPNQKVLRPETQQNSITN